jgi:hypothetical protein
MNYSHLPLTFCLDQDSALDTLEAVLAIARRGGLRLAKLNLEDHQVAVELRADDADLLALFSARLHNVIGVHDISLSTSFTFASDQTVAVA